MAAALPIEVPMKLADKRLTVQQQLESATMGSLRGGQYTDVYGNPISMLY